MPEKSSDNNQSIPPWLTTLSRAGITFFQFFWSVIFVGIILSLISNAITLPTAWTTVIHNISTWLFNNLLFTIPLLIILILLNIIFYLLTHPYSFTTKIPTSEKTLKKSYLRRITIKCEQLTLRGVPAGLIAESVRLDEVFIPMQLRPNRPRADYPLTDTELALHRQHIQSGTYPRELERAVVDAENNWQHILKQTDRISIGDMWSQLTNHHPAAVIQGYPGMGKSTLMERITLHMARQGLNQRDPDMPESDTFKLKLLPILLTLAYYAKERGKKPDLSVSAYIHIMLQELKIPGIETIIQKALQAGTCLVIFDGLDEVSNPKQREGVQVAIKEFIEEQRDQPGNRFLITSRVAGYDTAAFPNYPHYTLAELTQEQIDDFLPRWCHASLRRSTGDNQPEHKEAREHQVSQMVKGLKEALAGSQGVRDLAENPLLLTLLVVMQQNSIVLPRQRIELYRVVTETLLENRNIAKKLEPIPELQAIQRLGPLAFEMQKTGNSFVREKDVLNALTITISGGTDEEKLQEAKNFLERIRIRGGLFVQRTGDYFGFMHRTFQEYFAARYILNQIKLNRSEWIQRLIELVRTDVALWREPFLLAVAYQSSEDEVVASEMLNTLLNLSQIGTLEEQERDLLLATECVTEAKALSISPDTEKRIALAWLTTYEAALHEHQDETYAKVEDAMQSWLLSLPKEAYHPPLHAVLLQAINDNTMPTRQCTTLILLTLIVQNIKGRVPGLFDELIPPLLALTGLPPIGKFQPTKLAPSPNFNVADLALSTLSFMDEYGPAGLLLANIRQHFKEQPEQLRLLARYSLTHGELLTFTVLPFSEDNFQRYSAALERWQQLYMTHKTGPMEEEKCIVILQNLLANAEAVIYPGSYHLLKMLDASSNHPNQSWQSIWQDYLLTYLNANHYIDYQECIQLWIALFPQTKELQQIVDHLNQQFTNKGGHTGFSTLYAQRFIAIQSMDLSDLHYLRDIRYLHYLRNLRDLLDLRDFQDLHYLGDIRHIRGFRYIHDVHHFYDIHNVRYTVQTGSLRSLSGLIDTIKLDTLLFTKDNTQITLKLLETKNDIIERTDLLTILAGRITQISLENRVASKIEQEVQQITQVALKHLNNPTKDETWWTAREIIRSLPARSSSEIQSLLHLAENASNKDIRSAYIYALSNAQPDASSNAWETLEKESWQSKDKDIHETIEAVLKRKPE